MESANRLRELLRTGLKVGEARRAGPLTLVPLYGGSAGPDYLLAAEATNEGLLEIAEVPGGSVPELIAKNIASKPVLILDGEHLEGAMQDRVLNTTVLVAASGKTVLPVSCVEAGRWHYRDEANFTPSDDLSYSRLRHANRESVGVNIRAGAGHRSDQGQVWDEVHSKHAELGVPHSDTGAMKDAYDIRRGDLEKIIAELDRPEAGQTGVGVVVGGRAVAVDLFDKADTLEHLWPRLVRGYALDALGAEPSTAEDGAIAELIEHASAGEMTVHDGVGLGDDVVVTNESAIGKALVEGQAVIHMALFPRDRRGSDESTGGRIDSPRRRIGRHR